MGSYAPNSFGKRYFVSGKSASIAGQGANDVGESERSGGTAVPLVLTISHVS